MILRKYNFRDLYRTYVLLKGQKIVELAATLMGSDKPGEFVAMQEELEINVEHPYTPSPKMNAILSYCYTAER